MAIAIARITPITAMVAVLRHHHVLQNKDTEMAVASPPMHVHPIKYLEMVTVVHQAKSIEMAVASPPMHVHPPKYLDMVTVVHQTKSTDMAIAPRHLSARRITFI